MKDLEKELKNFLTKLSELQKEGKLKGYTLIGALAVSAYARPRATQDIDFLVSAERDFFLKNFPEILKQEGYQLKVYKGAVDDPVSGLIRLFDRESGAELIDIIPVFWQWQEEIVEGAEKVELFGMVIPVARLEDLLVLKLKAGGPQDLLDAEELLKAAKLSQKLDLARLNALAKKARISKNLKKLADKLQIDI